MCTAVPIIGVICQTVTLSSAYIKSRYDYLVHYRRFVENHNNRVEILVLRRDAVQLLVNAACRRGEEITDEVQGWLQEVVATEAVAKRLDDGVKENKRCFKCCPDLCSRRRGEEITDEVQGRLQEVVATEAVAERLDDGMKENKRCFKCCPDLCSRRRGEEITDEVQGRLQEVVATEAVAERLDDGVRENKRCFKCCPDLCSRRRGEEITDEVQGRLQEVVATEAVAERLNDGVTENKRCFKCCLCSRYSLGKEAKKKMVAVDDLLTRGNFTHVSNPRPPPSIESLPAGEFEAFESTEPAIEQVINALKDERINIIGVYGMGGVGKTTLVEQVGKKAKKEKWCDDVVKVTVSQEHDLEKIQSELAEKLGMQLTEKNVGVRAGRLLDRLKQEKKILIILDDLWDRLDLTQVGIPSAGNHEGCQIIIIMTTRNEDVCSKMNCQEIIKVKELSPQDSWDLFKEKASVDETDEVAKDVAKECKGLPLAIVTVARALKCKDSDAWENARRELRASCPKNIDNVYKDLYSCLELSYNYMEGEEVKSCFLFCCLFPEDYDIEVRHLMRYLVGEMVFKNVSKLKDAWHLTQTLVKKLKDSCLLLNSDKEGHVKMHDVVRDVAIWIASRIEHGSLVKAGVHLEDLPEKLEQCKRLSLMRNTISVLPKQPMCPHLQTLLLQNNGYLKEIPNNFFQQMPELLVLDLCGTAISSLPPSLPRSSNLRTLCFDGCGSLYNISPLKDLVNLEILSLKRTGIEELPIEIGDLPNLKLLDLTDTWRLERVPPNVISKSLEELYMRNSFNMWEVKGSSGDGSNASFDEVVASLSRLTVLYIDVADLKCISSDFSGPWGNLTKFGMRVSDDWEFIVCRLDFGNYMEIKIMSYPICKWVKVLLGRSEEIVLEGVCTNITHLLDDEGRGFNNLKSLTLNYCHEMEHIAFPPIAFGRLQRLTVSRMYKLEEVFDYEEGIIEKSHAIPLSTLEEIELKFLPKLRSLWKGAMPPTGTLHNLKKLVVYNCDSLTCLFSPVLAQNLQQLEELYIQFCSKMEKIICDEEMMPPTGTLHNLKKLVVFHCDSLTCLFSPVLAQNLQQLEELEIRSCSKMEKIICDEEMMPPTGTLHNLKKLVVSNCDSLTCLFSPVLAQKLQQLEELEIRSCSKMEKIICDEEMMPPTGTLHNLKKLVVSNCDSLTCLFSPVLAQNLQQLEFLEIQSCSKMEKIICDEEMMPPTGTLHNLKKLFVSSCDGLTCLFSPVLAQNLQQLEELDIQSCLKMEKIICDEEMVINASEEEQELGVVNKEHLLLPRLKDLMLYNLPKLWSLCYHRNNRGGGGGGGGGGSHVSLDFPSLESIQVLGCFNLKRLPFGPQRAPKLGRIDGEEAWFEGLEWEDEVIKSRLRPLFISISDGN
ncbi:putative disease resistance protein At4g27220 isoform X2 [Tasmannia lanceolata]|uniref:putative disease resistance protein At4g27220 isoform X2 n=1 Tax=Tasmannia lanceolata TaxID=3420 RepID=UPI0040627E0D